jgi:hypothetical protein
LEFGFFFGILLFRGFVGILEFEFLWNSEFGISRNFELRIFQNLEIPNLSEFGISPSLKADAARRNTNISPHHFLALPRGLQPTGCGS